MNRPSNSGDSLRVIRAEQQAPVGGARSQNSTSAAESLVSAVFIGQKPTQGYAGYSSMSCRKPSTVQMRRTASPSCRWVAGSAKSMASSR